MYSYQGKTALITGASSGIGEAFAQGLAARGMNVILVARSEAVLNVLAQKLVEQYHVRTTVLSVDLRHVDASTTIKERVQELGLQVDLLVNNAGFGTYGHFETLDAQRDREEVLVNVAAAVDLSHAFLPSMVERGDGAILNVASMASFQPSPYMAVYGASKAFILSFSAALWAEYRTHGIRVVALCPGPVETQFFRDIETHGVDVTVGQKPTPIQQVVQRGVYGLEHGLCYAIPGRSNRVLAMISQLMPYALKARLGEKMVRPHAAKSAGVLAGQAAVASPEDKGPQHS